ncbi:MAG: glycosyltransferase family 2 protein [Chitinivibrionales bacterium]
MKSRSKDTDISVIIPTYNCAGYIGLAIESVLAQSQSVRELLVIDDGSIDNTAEVVGKHAKNKKVKYIKKENGGQASARRYGVQNASGRYVAFLDADDVWEPRKIERQMEVLDDPQNHICFTEVSGIDEEGNPVKFEHVKGQTLRRGRVVDYLYVNNFVPHSSLVVEKKYIEQVGSFDESLRMGDDWDIVLRLSTCLDFEYVPQKLVRYRIRRNQLSRNFEQRIADQDRIVEKFKREYPQYLTTVLIRRGNAFRARNRGYHYAQRDLRKALYFYTKAVTNDPLNILNYRGIARSLVYGGLRAAARNYLFANRFQAGQNG